MNMLRVYARYHNSLSTFCSSDVDLHFVTVENVSVHFATAAQDPCDESCLWFHSTTVTYVSTLEENLM